MMGELVYSAFLDIFHQDDQPSYSWSVRAGFLCLQHLQLLSQNLRFIWVPSIAWSNWTTYQHFWEALSLGSIDSIFASLGQLFLFAMIALSLVALNVFTIFVKIFLNFNGIAFPFFYAKIFKFLLVITCEILFIPISISLLLVFKYSDTPTVIHEYSNYPDSSQFYNSFGTNIIALILLVFHLGLTVAYKGFCFEISHTKANKTFNAKSMPNVDLMVVLIDFIHCLCFVSIQQSYYLYYFYANVFTFGVCAWSHLFYLPFYSDFVNFIKFFVYFDCFCVSLFFIIASFMNDATIAMILSVVSQPIIFIIVKNAIEYRKLKIKTIESNTSSKLSNFELSARESLKIDTNPLGLMKKMYKNYSIQQNKLIFVYQANYCSKILRNPHLALVKASQTDYNGFSLFTNFQIYKCQKSLESTNIKTSTGLRLFLYLRDLYYILKEDKNFCMFFLKFFKVILSKNPNISDFFNSVKILADLVEKLKKKYEDCLKKNSNSQIVNEMYGSLLTKILFDYEKGETHLLSSINCAKSFSDLEEKNIFLKKDLHYMIISGSLNETGKILFASNNLKGLLGLNFDKERKNYLYEIIPKPYSESHDLNLIKFVMNSLSNKLEVNASLFLSNNEGFLIECILHIECVGFDSSVMFITIFDFNKTFDREAAIIDENWEIFSHTQRFPEFLDQTDLKLEKKSLCEMIPISVLEDLKEKEMLVYTFDSKTYDKKVSIGLILQKKQVFTQTVFTLYILEDKEILSFITNLETLTLNKRSQKVIKIFQLINKNKSSKLIKISKTDDNLKELDKLTLKITEQNQESTSVTSIKELNVIEKSKKSLTIIKTSIFLTVILTKVLSIALCNLVMIIYISEEVNNSNSLDAMIHLGDLSYYLTYLALVTRSIDISFSYNITTFYSQNDLAELLPVLNMHKNYTTDDYDKWNFCPSSSIVYQSCINTWNLLEYGNTVAFKSNLVDLLGNTIQHVIFMQTSSILAEFQKGSLDYDKDLFFIIYNSFRLSVYELSDAYTGLKQCENDRIEKLSTVVNYLFISGLGVIGFVCVLLVFYLKTVDKKINLIWNQLLTIAKSQYLTLQQKLITRLEQYHQEFDLEYNEDQHSNKNSNEINMKVLKKYILAISVLIAIALVLFIVAVYVFYQNIHFLLLYRLNFINFMLLNRLDLFQIYYYTIEIIADANNQGLSQRFDNFTVFPEFLEMLNRKDAELTVLSKVLQSSEIKNNLPVSVSKLSFKTVPGSSDFFHFGAYSGFYFLREEYSYLISNTKMGLGQLNPYFSELNTMGNILYNLTLISNADSKAQINNELNIMIYFIVGCLLFLFFLTFGYFIPYFSKDQKILESIEMLIIIFSYSKQVLPKKNTLDHFSKSFN